MYKKHKNMISESRKCIRVASFKKAEKCVLLWFEKLRTNKRIWKNIKSEKKN